MATAEQLQFLAYETRKAMLANHVWPAYAACEAALETAWGTSELYRQGNNVFGEKQHHPPIWLTLKLPTWEVQDGQRVEVLAEFVWFPSSIEAYVQRMKTLRRLAYPEYAEALAASSGEGFITEVSKRWSTDPERAAKVLSIYDAHRDTLIAALARDAEVQDV